MNRMFLRRRETVGHFAERWLRDFPRNRASTNRHLKSMVQPLVADLGKKKMGSVTRRDARRWSLAHPASVPAARALFTDAVDDEVITANPFGNLRIAKGRGRKDIVALTEDEVRELADAAEPLFGAYGAHFRALVLFAAYVGLRPGEMFALTWEDLDLTAMTVHISKSVGGHGEVSPPKNGKPRTVVLPGKARDALPVTEHRLDSEPIFHTPTGKRFTHSSHMYYWSQLREAAGHPALNFYELRHFCATFLLERGLRAGDVAVQLGHTDGGALVMSTYGHPEEAKALGRVQAAFDQ